MRLQVKNRQERGFTLLETASALLVMMIGGLGICAVFAYAIKNNTGVVTRYKKDDIKSRQQKKLSIMPAGLEKTLSRQELLDLVAFLRACK